MSKNTTGPQLTPAQRKALTTLALYGFSGPNKRGRVTLPTVRVLEHAGLVTVRGSVNTYTARRPFGQLGAGRTRSFYEWTAYITDAGRAALSA